MTHLPADPSPTGTVAEAKAAWRDRLLATRRRVVAEQGEEGRRLQSQRLAAAMLAELHRYAAARGRPSLSGTTVTAYEELRTEPPLGRFVAAAQREGARVLLPITLALHERLLDWHDAADPDRTPLGRQVLDEVDVCWVPALAVDRRGLRLGKGGGYYDNALPLLRPGTPRIAVLHDHELVEALPGDPHDVPVDAVVTAAAGVVRLTPPAAGQAWRPPPR